MRLQHQNAFLTTFLVVLIGLKLTLVYSTSQANVEEENTTRNHSIEHVCDSTEAKEQVCQDPNRLEKFTSTSTTQETMVKHMHSEQCKIYMAESSIPNAGLGVYTSTRLEKGDVLNLSDMVITHIDLFHNFRMSQLFTSDELQAWKSAIGSKVDSREDCPILAVQGECEANPSYMLVECAKSCALKQAGLEVKKSLIAIPDQGHQRCVGWAVEGECVDNPNFMIETCPYACVSQEYGIETRNKAAFKDWLPSDYYWVGEGIGIANEAEGAVNGLVPGVGALTNSHMGAVNVALRRHFLDSAGYHRATDPGVGAFSDRHNITFEATTSIPAGMELFLNYGENYFTSKEKALGPVPFEEDYEEADKLISAFWKEREVQQADDVDSASLYNAMLADIKEDRVKAALPSSYEILKHSEHTTTAMMKVPDAIRSKDWLQENGACLDNLRPETSTIPQAGRGAFATRSIMSGEMIAPLPLLQMSKNRIRRFRGMDEITPELSMNYSFGHPNSSMLLMPYAPVVNFVNNHLDKHQVNARIQWSSSKHHMEEWKNDSVGDIVKRGKAGLMLELIATKEIEEGDEVFLDYGERWDAAWIKHVEEWKPTLHSNQFDNIEELNAQEIVRTIEERKVKPYGTNVDTLCLLDVLKFVVDSKDADVNSYAWERYRMEDNDYMKPQTPHNTRSCEVRERYENGMDEDQEENDRGLGFLYEVSVFVFSVESGRKEVSIKGVPRYAIEFINHVYESNQFIENAFRHEIGIPDEIFPKKWMNSSE